MSQIDIVIKIKQSGDEAIKQVVKNLKEMKL